MFKKAIEEFNLPEGFVVTIDPWPYGGPDFGETTPRYTQGLCFAKDTRSGNEDSNHYVSKDFLCFFSVFGEERDVLTFQCDLRDTHSPLFQ